MAEIFINPKKQTSETMGITIFYHYTDGQTCTLSYDITMLRVMYVSFFYTFYNWAKIFMGELVCIFWNSAWNLLPTYITFKIYR